MITNLQYVLFHWKRAKFPEDEINKLKTLFESNLPVELHGGYQELFLEKSCWVAIETLEFPETQGKAQWIRLYIDLWNRLYRRFNNEIKEMFYLTSDIEIGGVKVKANKVVENCANSFDGYLYDFFAENQIHSKSEKLIDHWREWK